MAFLDEMNEADKKLRGDDAPSTGPKGRKKNQAIFDEEVPRERAAPTQAQLDFVQ